MTVDHLRRLLLAATQVCPINIGAHGFAGHLAASHLLDVGRAVVEAKLPRRFADRVTRALLRTVLPNPALFGPAVALGRAVRPLLPTSLADKLPPAQPAGAPWPG